MRKMFVWLLVLVMCLGAMAPAGLSEVIGSVDIDENISAMATLLDSVYLAVKDPGSYESTDEELIWSALYLMSVNWAYDDPLAVLSDTTISMPSALLAAYGEAMFTEFTGLPEIPAAAVSAGTILYNAEIDTYAFALSDRGDSYTHIDDCLMLDDGSLLVTIGLYAFGSDDSEKIDELSFIMVENAEKAYGELSLSYRIVSPSWG